MSWERAADVDRWKREFGERVRAIRLERGLSQLDLGHLAGLDPTYISGIERGRRNPSLTAIRILAHALKIPAAELLSDRHQPEHQPAGATASGETQGDAQG